MNFLHDLNALFSSLNFLLFCFHRQKHLSEYKKLSLTCNNTECWPHAVSQQLQSASSRISNVHFKDPEFSTTFFPSVSSCIVIHCWIIVWGLGLSFLCKKIGHITTSQIRPVFRWGSWVLNNSLKERSVANKGHMEKEGWLGLPVLWLFTLKYDCFPQHW